MISNRGGYGYSERTPHGEHTDRGEYSQSKRQGRDSYHDRIRNEYEPPEGRYRRRDSRGRFRSEGDMGMRGMAEDFEMEDFGMEDPMDAYGAGGYGAEGAFTGYSPRSSAPKMHKIGFSGEDDYEYPAMGGKHQKGKKLTQEMAEEWMEGLENADESDGPHFDMGKVARIMEERNVRGNPLWCIILSVGKIFIDTGGYAHGRIQQNHSTLLPPFRR